MKVVSGAPNVRPPWFFDAAEQGEGLNDIGTHLVDLVQWTLFPGKTIDYRSDIRVLAAQRWPTVIPEAEFQRVTGGQRFGSNLSSSLKDGALECYANTLVSYALRGVHTKLNVIWDWEAPPGGGDTHFAFYRGTRARIEVRQTAADKYLTELFVVPAAPELRPRCSGPRARRSRGWPAPIPGLAWRSEAPRSTSPSARPSRRPRGALRPGRGEFPRLRARPPHVTGLGTAQHARQVLRHHGGHDVEPQIARPHRHAHRAAVTGLRQKYR